MSEAWITAAEPPSGGHARGSTTLIDGTTFCISARNGDVEPGATHGLFVRDTRFLSCWRLRVDGRAAESVSCISPEPAQATFVSRLHGPPSSPDSGLFIARRRLVGEGMVEELEIRNLGTMRCTAELEIELGVDFSHLFEVKADQVRGRGLHQMEAREHELVYSFTDNGRSRRLVVVLPDEADVSLGAVRFQLDLAPRGRWRRRIEFRVELDGVPLEPRAGKGPLAPRQQPSVTDQPQLRIWAGDERLAPALARSAEDLRALEIHDPDHPDEVILAAGAPWYMALFGRDSILSSWMTLSVEPRFAAGTLRALARYQGEREDPVSEEQPGRILHEVRFRMEGPRGSTASAYFGSIDSTPLFVILLEEAARFGLAPELVAELLPHADRALEWIGRYGDRDGDGFVEYQRPFTHRGLANQGWKDSDDSATFADGRLAEAPIALCEVQGYVYGAWRAREALARRVGDEHGAARAAERAAVLAERFEAAFYLPDRGYYALGLDADKRPIDALASNMGHLLWSGLLTPARAREIADHLLSSELFSGFGVRTLAVSMARYNPMSYHNGAVWPHDNAIIVAGLVRYGFVEEAQRVAEGLLEASTFFDGHLPELFCGFDREDFAGPVAYPAACIPQAWASATPYSLLRSLLRLDLDLPAEAVHCKSALPDSWGVRRVEHLMLGGVPIAVELDGREVRLLGLAEHLRHGHSS